MLVEDQGTFGAASNKLSTLWPGTPYASPPTITHMTPNRALALTDEWDW